VDDTVVPMSLSTRVAVFVHEKPSVVTMRTAASRLRFIARTRLVVLRKLLPKNWCRLIGDGDTAFIATRRGLVQNARPAIIITMIIGTASRTLRFPPFAM